MTTRKFWRVTKFYPSVLFANQCDTEFPHTGESFDLRQVTCDKNLVHFTVADVTEVSGEHDGIPFKGEKAVPVGGKFFPPGTIVVDKDRVRSMASTTDVLLRNMDSNGWTHMAFAPGDIGLAYPQPFDPATDRVL